MISSPWKSLRALNLSKNSITVIDDSIKLLPKLEWLDLSHNKITELKNLELCTSLKSLNLSFNNIESLSGMHSKFEHMTELLLRHNRLIAIDGIENCFGIEKLDLSYNQIGLFKDLFILRDLRCMKRIWIEMNPVAYNAKYIDFVKSLFDPPETFHGLHLDGKLLYELKENRSFSDSERDQSNPRSYTPSPISNRYASKAKRIIKLQSSNGLKDSKFLSPKQTYFSDQNVNIVSQMEALQKEAGSKWLTIITEQKSHMRASSVDSSNFNFLNVSSEKSFSQPVLEDRNNFLENPSENPYFSTARHPANSFEKPHSDTIQHPHQFGAFDDKKGISQTESSNKANEDDEFNKSNSSLNEIKEDSVNGKSSKSSGQVLKSSSKSSSHANNINEVDQVEEGPHENAEPSLKETFGELSLDESERRIGQFLNEKHWIVNSSSGKCIISLSPKSIIERDIRGRIALDVKFSDFQSFKKGSSENGVIIEHRNGTLLTYDFEDEFHFQEFLTFISSYVVINESFDSLNKDGMDNSKTKNGSSDRSSVFVINHTANQFLFLISDYFDPNSSSIDRRNPEAQFAEDIVIMKSFVEQVRFFYE
jgi:hypothetical protein